MKNFFKQLFDDNNTINEKSVVGFGAFATTTLSPTTIPELVVTVTTCVSFEDAAKLVTDTVKLPLLAVAIPVGLAAPELFAHVIVFVPTAVTKYVPLLARIGEF